MAGPDRERVGCLNLDFCDKIKVTSSLLKMGYSKKFVEFYSVYNDTPKIEK